MKTINFISTIFVIALNCLQIQAQNDLPYRSLKLFNKDTIRYLDYNFTIRNEQYKGKTIADVVKDLELPISYLQVSSLATNSPYIRSIRLGIRMVKDKPDEENDYYVSIYLERREGTVEWENFIKVASLLLGENEPSFFQWTPQVYNTLKNTKIIAISANYYLFKDRRNLLKIATKENHEKLKAIMEKETEQWKKRVKSERIK
jgi:hypothetical protein